MIEYCDMGQAQVSKRGNKYVALFAPGIPANPMSFDDQEEAMEYVDKVMKENQYD